MIAQLRSRRITPLLMTSNPFLVREKNVALKSYVEDARQVARDEGVALVDVFARFAELRRGSERSPSHVLLRFGFVMMRLVATSVRDGYRPHSGWRAISLVPVSATEPQGIDDELCF